MSCCQHGFKEVDVSMSTLQKKTIHIAMEHALPETNIIAPENG